jgi:hypothetical protein
MASRFFDPFLIQKAKQQDFWDIYQRATERKDRQAQVISQMLSDMTRNVQRMITAKIREESQKRNYQRQIWRSMGNVLGMIVARPDYFLNPAVVNSLPGLKTLFKTDEKGRLKAIDLDNFINQMNQQPENWFLLETSLNNIYRIKQARENLELREMALQLRAQSVNNLRGITTFLNGYLKSRELIEKSIPLSKYQDALARDIAYSILQKEKDVKKKITDILELYMGISSERAKEIAESWIKSRETTENLHRTIFNFLKEKNINYFKKLKGEMKGAPFYGVDVEIVDDKVYQENLQIYNFFKSQVEGKVIFSHQNIEETKQKMGAEKVKKIEKLKVEEKDGIYYFIPELPVEQ